MRHTAHARRKHILSKLHSITLPQVRQTLASTLYPRLCNTTRFSLTMTGRTTCCNACLLARLNLAKSMRWKDSSGAAAAPRSAGCQNLAYFSRTRRGPGPRPQCGRGLAPRKLTISKNSERIFIQKLRWLQGWLVGPSELEPRVLVAITTDTRQSSRFIITDWLK